jgi:hypothetical protein
MQDMRTIFFYLHNPEEIHQAEKVQRLLQEIAAQDYYLVTDTEWEQTSAIWRAFLQSSSDGGSSGSSARTFQAGVSPLSQEQAEHFYTEKRQMCFLRAFSASPDGPMKGFTFDLRLDAEEGAVYISFDEDRFDRSTEEVVMYDRWLEMVRMIYTIWHPIYGYQLDHMGVMPYTPKEDIRAFNITRLYDLNLFGPELVQQLGRERIESAPAQKILPLDDGGIILLPKIYFYPPPNRDVYYDPEKVAAHLSLSYEENP